MTDGVQAAPTGRFAPSPTGELHFGSLLAALASYCDIKHRGGAWHLRIDDIDQPRAVAGSADAIQRSLQRLGFEWDGPVLWQSTRLDHYRDHLAALVDQGKIFACNCSRRFLPSGEPYPGRCRDKRIVAVAAPDAASSAKVNGDGNATPDYTVPDHALRMHLTGELTFNDAVQGTQHVDLANAVGDCIIWRRDGLVSYSLACAVDDAEQASHVVRGADLLESTGTQLAIMQALGLQAPHYAHIPVAVDSRGIN